MNVSSPGGPPGPFSIPPQSPAYAGPSSSLPPATEPRPGQQGAYLHNFSIPPQSPAYAASSSSLPPATEPRPGQQGSYLQPFPDLLAPGAGGVVGPGPEGRSPLHGGGAHSQFLGGGQSPFPSSPNRASSTMNEVEIKE